MNDHERDNVQPKDEHRRKFLKKGAATAPAVMLLLSAGSKPNEAQAQDYVDPDDN